MVAALECMLVLLSIDGTLLLKDEMPALFDSNTPILKPHIPVIAMACCALFIGLRMPMGIPACVGSVGVFD